MTISFWTFKSSQLRTIMLSAAFLVMCYSINFCIIVHQSTGGGSPLFGFGASDDDGDAPDFELMAGLTKTFFHKQTADAPMCDPLSASNITYTLVTQMSIDRFWLASRHCKRWKGPISMAVVTGKKTSQDLMHGLESKGCNTSQITVEAIQNIHGEYAVNTLRNMALRNVKTSHFVYVDVDFWVSANLYDVLHQDSIRQALADDPKLALVVPAFALSKDYRCDKDDNCTQRIKDTMPMYPEQLQALQNEPVEVSEGKFVPQITIFDELVNPLGHNTTLYEPWYGQSEGSLYPIGCFQSGKYEPYLVVRYCRDMPPFQEDFTGYGKNKVAWIWHLRRVGYLFKQIGRVFVVHYPHKISIAKRKWVEQTKKHAHNQRKLFGVWANSTSTNTHKNIQSYKRAQMDEIYVRFRNWLSRMKTPVRTPRCKDWINTDNNLWSATPLIEKPW